MRTPSSALPALPHGFDEGRGPPFVAGIFVVRAAFNPAAFRADFFAGDFLAADFFAADFFLDEAVLRAAFLAFLPALFVRVAIAVLLKPWGPQHAAMKVTSCAARSED
jgi:hypothetical protein